MSGIISPKQVRCLSCDKLYLNYPEEINPCTKCGHPTCEDCRDADAEGLVLFEAVFCLKCGARIWDKAEQDAEYDYATGN